MTTPVYRVVDWEANYENNRTKELKHLTWIRMPTKHDGDGYTQLLDHPNAAAHFGAWVAMVEVAGKCDPRGTLVRESGRPHTAESLSRMTRIPAVVFEEVIPRLVSIDIGWLEVVGCAALTEGQQVIPHEGAAIPHVTPTLSRESREEESREKENANIVLTDDNCAMSSLDASSTNTKEEAGKLAVYFLEKTSASLKRKLVTSPAATAGGIRKLIQKDITPDEIKATIDWLCTVNLKREFSFQVHSGNSLYEKYDKIRGAMGTDERKRNTRRGPNI